MKQCEIRWNRNKEPNNINNSLTFTQFFIDTSIVNEPLLLFLNAILSLKPNFY